jgi:hypothetical protein
MRRFCILILLLFIWLNTIAQFAGQMPVRGFCIAAPRVGAVGHFNKFIRDELAPRAINVLILRIDYNYQFERHPELRDSSALSTSDVKSIVETCRKTNIAVIPQINLLGHQSWAERIGNLLRVHPQFDETPHVKMPEKYEWPNSDGLYCKSYCPLHPDVHKIVFELVDEICDVFEADAFHAGLDEVFYIGDDKCPRCSGRDKAELFAGEVQRIRDHLKAKNRRLWMWGDRLLDGKTTGLGMWEASMNNTHRAIDLIPKDVMICDWHYERPDKTSIYFAMKGFDVVTCPWRNPSVAIVQRDDVIRFKKDSTPEVSAHVQGLVQTVWSDFESFSEGLYGKSKESGKDSQTAWNCFNAVFPKLK